MSATGELITLYQSKIGSEIHCGAWLTIDQQRIDAFAAATGDQQWIHTDPARAVRESPYGTTVAHGFLTLSLLPFLTESNAPGFFEQNYPCMKLRLNYGLNRVRFPAPVTCGSRIRARTKLVSVERAGEGVEFIYQITIDIEDTAKPACVAEFIARVY